MNYKKLSLLSACVIGGLISTPLTTLAAVNADGTVGTSEGTATFEVNTGPGPDVKSPLRIEEVSDITFGSNLQISGDEHTYSAAFNENAGVFSTPNIVINDARGTNAGWTLQLSNTQFTNELDATDQLDNAVLSFTEVRPVSKNNYSLLEAPELKDSVELNGSQTPVSILNASADTGIGTWVNNFGEEVDATKTATSENSAIQLTVPGRTTKTANVKYVSVLTWTLLDTPDK